MDQSMANAKISGEGDKKQREESGQQEISSYANMNGDARKDKSQAKSQTSEKNSIKKSKTEQNPNSNTTDSYFKKSESLESNHRDKSEQEYNSTDANHKSKIKKDEKITFKNWRKFIPFKVEQYPWVWPIRLDDLDSPGNGICYGKNKNCWGVSVANVDNSGRDEAKLSRCFGINAYDDAKFEAISALVASLLDQNCLVSTKAECDHFLDMLKNKRMLTEEDVGLDPDRDNDMTDVQQDTGSRISTKKESTSDDPNRPFRREDWRKNTPFRIEHQPWNTPISLKDNLSPCTCLSYSSNRNCWAVKIGNLVSDKTINKTFNTNVDSEAKWNAICFLVQSLYDADALSSSSEELDRFLIKLKENKMIDDSDLANQ